MSDKPAEEPQKAGAEREDDSEGSEISLDEEGLDELEEKAGRPKGNGGDADDEDIGIGGGPPAAGASVHPPTAGCFPPFPHPTLYFFHRT